MKKWKTFNTLTKKNKRKKNFCLKKLKTFKIKCQERKKKS